MNEYFDKSMRKVVEKMKHDHHQMHFNTDKKFKELEQIFRNHGFIEKKVRKFEEYSLYIENMNFLRTKNIISFMNSDGKLVALKPDITLSIIKNIPDKRLQFYEKLYYIDEVYRISKDTGEYKELKQIGVELIGDKSSFSNLEIINLALESLNSINDKFVLDISHLDFLSAYLKDLKIPKNLKYKILDSIHLKSSHNIEKYLDGFLDDVEINNIKNLCDISDNLEHSLKVIKPMVKNDKMQIAYVELLEINKFLKSIGKDSYVKLDFSIRGDINYYNGVIFKGYIPEYFKEVLTGGRYDKLLEKMGKNNSATGFAINLPENNNKTKTENDFDILIEYDENCDMGILIKEAEKFIVNGKIVRFEKNNINSEYPYSFDKKYKFEENILKEDT